MNSEDVTSLSLSELALAIERRELSSEKVVAACLERIATWQPSRNCFIHIDGHRALEHARQCDLHLAKGFKPLGPLHGVPLAHKDMFYRKGEISTCGSKIRQNWVADTTATVIKRLDQAGAIQIGTLNMAEFAGGPTGHNSHYGHCASAYSAQHISGGSSSGSGSAVGARLIYGALGSDTGGSIRMPATANNIVGIKPTYGRVSRYGAMPRSWSLDHIGVLGRTAADCALMMQIISGHDPMDSTSSHESVPDFVASLEKPINGLKIGYVNPSDLSDVDPIVLEALEVNRQILADLGAVLVQVKLANMRPVFEVAETIVKSEAAAMHGPWLREHGEDYTPLFRSRIEVGMLIPATDYINALRLRAKLTQSFIVDTMRGIDMLQLPSIPFPLPTISETDTDAADGDTIRNLIGKIGAYQRPINLFGLPSVSIPGGFCPQGLPIGFQLVGHPFAEDLLLATAHHFQAATPQYAIAPTL